MISQVFGACCRHIDLGNRVEEEVRECACLGKGGGKKVRGETIEGVSAPNYC